MRAQPPQEFCLLTRVFLTGCSRSGTTVVQRCLSAHPDLISFPETDFFGRLVGGWNGALQARLGRVRPERRRRAFGRLAEVLQQPEIAPIGNTNLGFRRAVGSLIEILDGIASERGATGWVEKTPKHYRYVGLLERAAPDVRFIHVVRDGRDVVASLVDRARNHSRFRNRLDPLAAARLWNEAIRTASRYRASHRHLVLAYEDFVHDPATGLQRVCDFLGYDYDSAMLETGNTEEIINVGEPWKSGATQSVALQQSKFNELLSETQQRAVMRALDWRRYRHLFPDGVGHGRRR
jgi:hypothetical protein